MDTWVTLLLAGGVGVLAGITGTALVQRGGGGRGRDVQVVPEPLVPSGVAAVLSVLRSSVLVIGPADEVLKASAPAHAMGLVRGNRVAVEQLMELVRLVRRDGQIREDELTIRRDRHRSLHVGARVAPLGSRLILILVEDHTNERRVEQIRRDFVANVSHELKTPVGALNLLAEAVNEAANDPVAVRRFSARMRIESERLTRLVQQIIELSRLQGDDPLEDPDTVSVDVIVERAVDRVKVDALDKGVDVVFAGDAGFHILGNGDQLVVALGNLVQNAVVYSRHGTKVSVTVKPSGAMIDIAVVDQGMGIPAAELERIFERFYRVDPARARATGGTGLGLSIVKHVVATHAGEVRVWSAEGEGSTFTISLPSAPRGSQPFGDVASRPVARPATPAHRLVGSLSSVGRGAVRTQQEEPS